MNRNYLILCAVMSIGVNIFAQQDLYKSDLNPYYWKNKKPFEGYWQQDVHYNIYATLLDSIDVIDGEETLTYDNNSPDTLNLVYFHLYQNAFLKGGYLQQLNRANKFYQQFGKYERAGKGTEIIAISVNKTTVPPPYTDEQGNRAAIDPIINQVQLQHRIDYSIMEVQLSEPLLPGASVTFNIKFKTYFDNGGDQRRRMKLFDAFGNKHYDGVHWYPRICVYDRKFGWATDQHLGKEFYGDFGTYEVALNFPAYYVLDATGLLLNKEEVLPAALRAKLDIANFKNKPLNEPPSVPIPRDGTYKVWKFRAINVHDFAWTADPTYRIGETNITLPNGKQVQCIALAQEPHASRWQDAASFAAKIIQIYSNDFGLYAYPKMIVADARDGMEYPMLTLDGGLSPGYYGLFAHEIGHNWFFGMVGNNETYRASLDEGFTQFLTHWSMSKLFGEQSKTRAKGYVSKFYQPLPQMDQTVYLGYLRDAINKTDAPLNTHSDDFGGALNHGGGYGHVYYKTATMLYNLQYVLGDSLFLSAMQHYFNQWKMCHPYFEDFRNSIINHTHVDLNWFFDQWMETTKTIDYAIKGKPVNIKNADGTPGNTYRIKLKRKGEMQMPIDLMAYSQDGKIYTTVISNNYFAKKDASGKPMPLYMTWRGWGLLNPTFDAIVYCPGGLKKVSIDTTYRLADVYQLDNSTKCPVKFSFDHQIKNPLDRRHYILKWRPDVWYNSIDGVKAGLHFNGNYMNFKHQFKATVWYNTQLARDDKYQNNQLVNYNIGYTNNIATNFSYYLQSRFLDGLWMHSLGISKTVRKNVYTIYAKSLYRDAVNNLDYLLYPLSWQAGKYNNTLNLEYNRSYHYKKGDGKIVIGLRNTTLASDYNYASAFISVVNNNSLGKLDFRTRFFAQYMTGKDVAPESRLNVAGANSEQLMDNKFVRSQAFVPTSWLGYGADVNHFQQGGGLNIRGYAGYALPESINNQQVQLYAGMSGIAGNAELDFDKLVRIEPRKLREYIHIDAYLFGDVGIIQNTFRAGEYNLTEQVNVTSDLLMSVGTGFALTIKKWGRLDEPKPLTLRMDMPWFLNKTPFVDGEYLRFRWVVGVSRCF